MTHDDARLLASAVADGEAARTPELDAHLASCAGCAAYADGLARLSTLTAALPRATSPALAERLRRRRRTRRALRWVPALAAATAAAVALTVLPAGDTTFPAPPAAAAEPLKALRSLYLERTVTGPDGVTTERIWFRAPASVRVETTRNGVTTTRIETPGTRYEDGRLHHDEPPGIPLPEPLSPTIALFGTDAGPGPVIAGRPTRTFGLTVAGQTRVAYVDTERSFLLGGDEALVLGKMSRQVTKRVTRVERDVPIPDERFAPPPGAPRVPGGFSPRPLDDLSIEPERLPEGFATVLSGSSRDGDSALLAAGSLPLLVTTRASAGTAADVVTETRGDRTYLVSFDLYAPPTVEFLRDGVSLKLIAPLPVASLIDLAERMYPRE